MSAVQYVFACGTSYFNCQLSVKYCFEQDPACISITLRIKFFNLMLPNCPISILNAYTDSVCFVSINEWLVKVHAESSEQAAEESRSHDTDSGTLVNLNLFPLLYIISLRWNDWLRPISYHQTFQSFTRPRSSAVNHNHSYFLIGLTWTLVLWTISHLWIRCPGL